jgi:hypothetical protein
MSERVTSFVIGNNQEEFECHVCGSPMYVGDRAVEVQSDKLECEYVVCSAMCHTRNLREYDRMSKLHNDASWAT